MKTIFAFACLFALWGCVEKRPQKVKPVPYVTDSAFKAQTDSLRRQIFFIQGAQETQTKLFNAQLRRLERQHAEIVTRRTLAVDSSRAIDRAIDDAINQPNNSLTLFGL